MQLQFILSYVLLIVLTDGLEKENFADVSQRFFIRSCFPLVFLKFAPNKQ